MASESTIQGRLLTLAHRIRFGGPHGGSGWPDDIGLDSTNSDPRKRMLKGEHAGGCGYQPQMYGVWDGNVLSGHGLEPYYPADAAVILDNVEYWLHVAGYTGLDRRETIFGKKVPGIYGIQNHVLQGTLHCPPSNDPADELVLTELPDTTRVQPPVGMNHLVVTALNSALHGASESQIQTLYNQTVSSWKEGNGIGFLDPPAKKAGLFQGRDLAYWLIMVRALRIQSPIEPDVETRLWSLQDGRVEGGLRSVYCLDGTIPYDKRWSSTNHEINGLALLAYDSRLTTKWWP